MDADMPGSLQRIIGKDRLTADDVLAIRRQIYPDGVIGPREAEWLLALDAACPDFDPSWPVLFVEALTDFVVHQMEPAGFVSHENAAWLMAKLGADGRIASATELELLVKILESATACPPQLSAYALAQVKEAVVSGEGPLRHGQSLAPGRVTAGDVDLLRRTLYAAGGAQHIAVTREEADVLFDISDATAGADNDPAWPDLFVKAVANHIMFASGYTPPSREEALRREAWLEDDTVDIGGFLGRMASSLASLVKAQPVPSAEDRPAVSTSLAEAVTAAEAEWLARRITADGRILPHEAALLSFIKRESPLVHPSLQALLDKVA